MSTHSDIVDAYLIAQQAALLAETSCAYAKPRERIETELVRMYHHFTRPGQWTGQRTEAHVGGPEGDRFLLAGPWLIPCDEDTYHWYASSVRPKSETILPDPRTGPARSAYAGTSPDYDLATVPTIVAVPGWGDRIPYQIVRIGDLWFDGLYIDLLRWRGVRRVKIANGDRIVAVDQFAAVMRINPSSSDAAAWDALLGKSAPGTEPIPEPIRQGSHAGRARRGLQALAMDGRNEDDHWPSPRC